MDIAHWPAEERVRWPPWAVPCLISDEEISNAKDRKSFCPRLRRRCGEAHAMAADSVSRPAHARGLYGFPRDLDQQGCGLIVAFLPVEEGLGPAIANGLCRAAGPRPTA